jgi:type I restriction enzyme S subunit
MLETKVQMDAIEAPLPEQCRIVAYLDELQAKVEALRRLQAETGAEMDALLPAVLDKAFKGEL